MNRRPCETSHATKSPRAVGDDFRSTNVRGSIVEVLANHGADILNRSNLLISVGGFWPPHTLNVRLLSTVFSRRFGKALERGSHRIP